ncbi:ATP synthase F0 subunit B [Neobacillus notoginsengisoli]|nr:ATP synthase F0 subunit B [Neobacillus notoginsengisoli]
MGDFEILGIPVSLGTMIYQALIFTILVFLIKKFVMSRLIAVLEKRKTYIGKQLMLAELYKQEAEQKLLEQNGLVAQARQEARKIRSKSEEEARALFEKTRLEAREIIHNAKDDARRIHPGHNEHWGA